LTRCPSGQQCPPFTMNTSTLTEHRFLRLSTRPTSDPPRSFIFFQDPRIRLQMYCQLSPAPSYRSHPRRTTRPLSPPTPPPPPPPPHRIRFRLPYKTHWRLSSFPFGAVALRFIAIQGPPYVTLRPVLDLLSREQRLGPFEVEAWSLRGRGFGVGGGGGGGGVVVLWGAFRFPAALFSLDLLFFRSAGGTFASPL